MKQERTHKHVARTQVDELITVFMNESKEVLLHRIKSLLLLLDPIEIRNIYEFHCEQNDIKPTQHPDEKKDDHNPYVRI
jgi:hypothetical protein